MPGKTADWKGRRRKKLHDTVIPRHDTAKGAYGGSVRPSRRVMWITYYPAPFAFSAVSRYCSAALSTAFLPEVVGRLQFM